MTAVFVVSLLILLFLMVVLRANAG